MNWSAVLVVVSLVLACPPSAGQTLSVAPASVPPGTSATITLKNNSPASVVIDDAYGGLLERVFSARGELVYGRPKLNTAWVVAAGTSWSSTLFTSATPLGALPAGHYFWEVNLTVPGISLTAPFTIGAPANPAPTFFVRFRNGFDAHDDPSAGPAFLSITNGTGSMQTFPGATWTLTTPGASPAPPPVTGTIPAFNLAAGRTSRIPWPGAPTAGITERLVVAWTDPTAGATADALDATGPLASSGIMPLNALLLRPAGDVVPAGGALPLFVLSLGSPYCPGLCGPGAFYGLDAAALLFALSAGSLPLPGGAVLPLTPDPVLFASLGGAFAPILAGSPAQTSLFGPAFHTPGKIAPMALFHPGPAASGITLLAAGLSYSPNGALWQASAAHAITFQ